MYWQILIGLVDSRRDCASDFITLQSCSLSSLIIHIFHTFFSQYTVFTFLRGILRLVFVTET